MLKYNIYNCTVTNSYTSENESTLFAVEDSTDWEPCLDCEKIEGYAVPDKTFISLFVKKINFKITEIHARCKHNQTRIYKQDEIVTTYE